MYRWYGEDFFFGDTAFKAGKEGEEQAARFFAMAQDLLARGMFRPHPAEVRGGGLEGVLGGLQDLREKKVTGRKLVYVL